MKQESQNKIEVSEKLSKEEQHRLFLQLNELKKSGDKSIAEIRERLITGNIELALSIVDKILEDKESKIEIEDIRQIAMIALIRAVDSFDPNYINKSGEPSIFSQYLYITIQNEIIRQFNIQETSSNFESIYDTHVPEDVFSDASRPRRALSEYIIDGTYVDNETNEILDEISTEDLAEYPLIVREILEALYTLPKEIREVITERYGIGGEEPKTRKQVGEKLGISEEAARRYEDKAILLLRHPSRGRKLRLISREDLSYFGRIDKIYAIRVIQEIEAELDREINKMNIQDISKYK